MILGPRKKSGALAPLQGVAVSSAAKLSNGKGGRGSLPRRITDANGEAVASPADFVKHFKVLEGFACNS